MLRNLLASAIILAASTSAFATIAEDVANKVPADKIAQTAVSACAGDSACEETVLKEMLDAGLSVDAVSLAAVNAGVDQKTFVNAVDSAGLDANQGFTAFANATTKIAGTDSGNPIGKPAGQQNKGTPPATVPAGSISSTK